MEAERNARIVSLRRRFNYTYQEIGNQFGLTRERIRQILKRYAPDLCYCQPESEETVKRRGKIAARKAARCELRADVVRLREEGLRYWEIAQHLGITERAAQGIIGHHAPHLNKRGLSNGRPRRPRRLRHRWADDQRQRVRALFLGGMTIRQVAAEMEMHVNQIVGQLQRMGVRRTSQENRP